MATDVSLYGQKTEQSCCSFRGAIIDQGGLGDAVCSPRQADGHNGAC